MDIHTLDIAPALSEAERQRLDRLALSKGATPEALAAAAVRKALRRSERKPAVFRLKMPEQAQRTLQEHAKALGCQAGELAAFLFSRKEARAQAVIAS